MNAIPETIGFLVSLLINLGLAYVTYLIYVRKQCSKALMLKCSAIVAGGSGLITALTLMLPEYIPAGCDLIASIMLMYHCARSIMKVERKPALLCAITFFGIIMLLGLVVALLLVALMSAAKV